MSRLPFARVVSMSVASLLLVGGARALPSHSSPPSESKSGQSSEQQQQSLYDQGLDLAKSEQYAEARKIFERLEVEQPKNPDVLNMLAYTQRKTGDLDVAIENYRKALAIKPKFPEAREYLAEAFLQAALREAETLKGYGGKGDDELEKLVDAFQAAASHAGDVRGGGGGGKTASNKDGKSNW